MQAGIQCGFSSFTKVLNVLGKEHHLSEVFNIFPKESVIQIKVVLMVNEWLKHFYLLIPWLSPLYEVTNTHVSVFLLRLKIQVTCPARLGCFLFHWTCWGLKHAPLWSQQLHTEGYGLVERALYWVTAACFQSTHPLTLLKTGTVTVSKRLRDMSTREVCGVCVWVFACACVYL